MQTCKGLFHACLVVKNMNLKENAKPKLKTKTQNLIISILKRRKGEEGVVDNINSKQ